MEDVVAMFGGSTAILVKPHHIDGADDVVRNFRLSDRCDGLIFTPLGDPYPVRPSWPSLLKWKPEEKLSIDFQLQCHPCGMGFQLCVVGPNQVLIPFDHAPLRDSSAQGLAEGVIVECTWDKMSKDMVVVRERTDKLRPNFHEVAEEVWEAIQSPVKQDDLLSTTFHTMRRHHNSIKRDILRRAAQMLGSRPTSVLDLACGRGGDLAKLQALGCEAYYGFDVNDELLAEAQKRSCPLTMKTDFQRQDLRKAAVNLPHEVPLVTCNFALHYFWGSLGEWEKFLASVTGNLASGGIFACTLFDGLRVLRLLMTGGAPCVNTAGKGFDLRPGFDHRMELALLRSQEFGLPLSVVLLGDQGVILKQLEEEYLVFADQLIYRMSMAGLILRDSGIFSTGPDLDDQEKKLCSLNRFYIFQKVSGVRSDAMSRWEPFSGVICGANAPLFTSKHPKRPDEELRRLTGLYIESEDLEALACHHSTAIGVVDNTGKQAATRVIFPADGDPHIAIWFLRSAANYHCIALFRRGEFHLRFQVTPALKKMLHPSECVTLDTHDEGSVSDHSSGDTNPISEDLPEDPGSVRAVQKDGDGTDTFLGRSLGRTKGSWTLEELKAHAAEQGVILPTSRRSKQGIANFLQRQ